MTISFSVWVSALVYQHVEDTGCPGLALSFLFLTELSLNLELAILTSRPPSGPSNSLMSTPTMCVS